MLSKILSVFGWLIIFVVLFLGVFDVVDRSWYVIVAILFGLLLALSGGGVQTKHVYYLLGGPDRYGVFTTREKAQEEVKPGEIISVAIIDEVMDAPDDY